MRSLSERALAGPIYIFAGGGTGGHVYPGLAVAAEVVRRQGDAKVVFACSDRPIDRQILDATPYAVVVQPVQPIPRGLAAGVRFLRAYVSSALLARQMIADLSPAAVLGLGGFAAGPLVCRAAKTRIRTGLLNPDAVPGKANRLLARRVDAIFTQFAATAECFGPAARGKVRQVGCPVRRELTAGTRDEAVRHFGLRPDRRTLFVNGGSQGAASVNEALARLAGDLDELADTWQVLHVTGRMQVGYVPHEAARIHMRVVDYCERMDLAYAAADLALTRGGAGTVAELMATATPAVVMPYPYHADQQQRLNAAVLCEAGAAVIVDDAKAAEPNAARLRVDLLTILRDAGRLGQMTLAAANTRTVSAAEDVARWLTGG